MSVDSLTCYIATSIKSVVRSVTQQNSDLLYDLLRARCVFNILMPATETASLVTCQ